MKAPWHPHPRGNSPEAASPPIPHNDPHPSGLKPTLRHLMILVLWSALVFTGLRFLLRLGFFAGTPANVLINLVIAVPLFPAFLLGLLLLCLDRPGPVRGWYVTCCYNVWGLVNLAGFFLVDAVCFATSGHPTVMFPMLPILALLMAFAATRELGFVWPRRCQCCQCRAIIPLWKVLPNLPRISGNSFA